MAGQLVTIDLGGVKYALDPSTEDVKILLTTTPTTGGLTAHDLEDNADYQVPAGKTFTIIAFQKIDGGATRTIEIFQADSADSTTGEVDKVAMTLNGNASPVLEWFSAGWLPTVAAEKFVNYKTDNATATPSFGMIIGVES